MTHKIDMGNDRILRITLEGLFDETLINAFDKEYRLYMDASTPDDPIHMIYEVRNLRHMNSYARKYFMEINKDSRIGLIGVLNASRPLVVLGKFISVATGRDNIAFFDEEPEALSWMNLMMSAKVTH